MQHFRKLEVNLTPEGIYMKGECGLKKHTHTHYIILYYTILYYIILYYFILYYFILYILYTHKCLYIYKKKLYQQVFIYNKEAQCSSQTSCA